MITFHSPSIKDTGTFKQLKDLNFFTSLNFNKVWREYLKFATDRNRVIGDPVLRFGEGEINVMGIRNNPEVSFNDEYNFYNDLLIIEHTIKASQEFYIFKATMDPKGKSNNIAHLLEGVYASYTSLRPHKYMPGRTAIVQDKDSVLVTRTNSNGDIIKGMSEHEGLFGINIHDSGGYTNSSMGCTVLEKDSSENNFHWEKFFKPLIKTITNKADIDYIVINKDAVIELARSAAYSATSSRSILDKICFRIPFKYEI